nr:hypothetical protein BgiMline_016243 [Biomphalaria glabrata]
MHTDASEAECHVTRRLKRECGPRQTFTQDDIDEQHWIHHWRQHNGGLRRSGPHPVGKRQASAVSSTQLTDVQDKAFGITFWNHFPDFKCGLVFLLTC